MNQLINASLENNTDSKNVVQSYYDIDEIQNMNIPNKNKSLVLFHVNVFSLNKTFDDLEHILSCTNKHFDVIFIT